MIWRVIFCWLLATTFAHANLPRHSAFPNFPRVNQYQVGGISLPNAASIANSYDGLGRLTSTALVDHWGHVLDGYGYTLDTMGLRTNIIRQLGLSTNNIAIAYDPISQITNWSGTETNGTLRQNEQLSYAYDAAGNLLVRTNNALVQTFTVDSLNQLSNVTRTGTLTVSGSLPEPPGSVTVNGTNAQTNSDFTFAASGNTLISGANTFTIVADDHYGSNITTSVVSVNLPATVNIQYDANGNLISDGTRTFQYDAENQLTNVYATNAWRVGFVYDGLKRKRVEIDSTWSSGWVPTNGTEFIYDGNLVIQERTTNNVVSVTYTRGLDMGGSLQGAGGIGGLLARTDGNGSTFYHADGSGNITALMDANQRVTARYEYDPYGRMLGMWGTNAPVNRYRFSSKEFISAAQLYAYGRRFYEPNFSRWLNRDPIGERGGINLYGFLGNNPVNVVDPLGLLTADRFEEIVSTLSAYNQYLTPVSYSAGQNGQVISTPDEQGINDATPELGFFIPVADVGGALLGATGDALGPIVKDALDKLRLGKPKAPALGATKCLSKAARLDKVFKNLSDAPSAKTASEAMQQMNSTLDAVEDTYSGVPKNPNPGLSPDGRMYPAQADNTVTTSDGSIVATSKGHVTTYSPNGSITVTDKATGAVVYTKPGGG